jgi:aspartyl-tRNA(Asn)/glutamyl-tRNA(Gln) amidotransferase subunit A
MSEALHALTVAELARRIRSKQLSPVELARALIERIETLDPQVNAFITLTADLALAQARKAEAEIAGGGWRGPMHGMPFALKDIFETAGILTSGHSRICIDHVPARDGFAVAKLHAAGAVLLGKLATHEFAHGGPSFDLPWPPARNPWHLEHITGGSSSGPGAAVAAGFVPAALGSDTGGSIRTPSALCGLAGLKPTYGLVSRAGVLPNSWSFDHCGPMARSVEDCALVLQAIAGHDPADPGSALHAVPDYSAALRGGQDLRGIRIGVARHLWEEDIDTPAELVRATDVAIDTLRSLGATVEQVRMYPAQVYHDVKTVISLSELFSIYRDALVSRPGDFGADFLGRGGLAGALFSASDYMLAQRVRRGLLEAAVSLHERFDVLVTPGAGPAPRLDAHRTVSFWEKPSLFSPFSVFGNPALIVCCGYSGSGLPMGLQIGGRPFDESTVLRVGHAYEQATGWRARQPTLVPGAARPPVVLAPAAPLDGRVTPEVRAAASVLSRQAGLVLDEQQFDQLLRAAPHAFEMMRRIREPLARAPEPANTFRFDPCTLPGEPR